MVMVNGIFYVLFKYVMVMVNVMVMDDVVY